jgi:POT family proton-dependent oligopeptide transporter
VQSASPSRGVPEKHPKGLYVLFATEMWERFSYYSMLALFALYMRNPDEGFGWTGAQATGLLANYLMFVYASPLVGGFIADRKLGYRRAVIVGGFFFMAGHLLLSFRSLPAVYAALTCLVIGNGFFKPNVSTMVGNLYREGSHLKDRAYNIFYMGINIGAFLAPVVAEFMKTRFGYHPAFAVAAFGMVISVSILWGFRRHVEDVARKNLARNVRTDAAQAIDTAATAVDAPPHGVSHQNPIDRVPDSRRIGALIVVFLIVIVFWMVFHQNHSTLTYWADDNTRWNVTGTIASAINPFWIVTLTFPLVWFWRRLDQRGKEPATPTKMAIGMFLTALSFYILFAAARSGEAVQPLPGDYQKASFRITDRARDFLRDDGVPDDVVERLDAPALDGVKFSSDSTATGLSKFSSALGAALGPDAAPHRDAILRRAFIFRVSPLWLILAYAVLSLGELMLSPMGLSLVSKVAPIQRRGLMMGGWFCATAIGNKLTAIGVFWEQWLQSSFFLVLGTCALVMAIVLFLLMKPLKKAMPGV